MSENTDEVELLADAVAMIRRHPEMYGGPAPRASRMAARLAAQLIESRFVPVMAEQFDGWWLIVAQQDWLTVDGEYKPEAWRRIIPAPEFGPNSMHFEIILTALARCVVTVSRNGLETIIGDCASLDPVLATRLEELAKPDFRGRVVAFLAD